MFNPSYQVCNTFIYSTHTGRVLVLLCTKGTILRLHTDLSLNGQDAENQYIGGELSHEWDIYITSLPQGSESTPEEEKTIRAGGWEILGQTVSSGHDSTAALMNLTTAVLVCTRPC